MATQLEQTKRAIAGMRTVLARNEFSVQTPFNKKQGGWDDTKVCVKDWVAGVNEKMERGLDTLLQQGFNVCKVVGTSPRTGLLRIYAWVVTVTYDDEASYSIWNTDRATDPDDVGIERVYSLPIPGRKERREAEQAQFKQDLDSIFATKFTGKQ